MHRMLKKLSQNFELILYSSGRTAYAEAVMDYIEKYKNQYFQYRLYKDDCFSMMITKDREFCAKDVRILLGEGSGRDIKDIIVVDNIISNFML
jgi:TFIIF-interacting CTD phosphatase-like protein